MKLKIFFLLSVIIFPSNCFSLEYIGTFITNEIKYFFIGKESSESQDTRLISTISDLRSEMFNDRLQVGLPYGFSQKFLDSSYNIDFTDRKRASLAGGFLSEISARELGEIKFCTNFQLPHPIFLHKKTLNTIIKNCDSETYKKLQKAMDKGLYCFYYIMLKDALIVFSTFTAIVSLAISSFHVINNILIQGCILPRLKKYTEKKMFENLISPEIITDYSLEDLIGYEKIKEIFAHLNNKLAEQKNKLSKIPSVLLFGEPGTGKTNAVRALAGSSGVPLFIITVDKLLNEQGSIDQRLNLLFERAKTLGPCIILLDDVDLLIGSRFENNSSKTLSITERIALNNLLQKLDGIAKLEGVLVIANTNYKENIDPALLRSGRFSTQIEFKAPTQKDVQEILLYYLKKNNLTIEKENFDEILAQMITNIDSSKEKNVAMIVRYVEDLKEHIKKKITLKNIEMADKNIKALNQI